MADAKRALRRELGLRDVTLFAIACIVGPRWLGSAAQLGPPAISLWWAAALLYAVPQAIAVGALTRRDPQAGGLYWWVRHEFGEWHAFLAMCLYWAGVALWFPNAALAYLTIASYGGTGATPGHALVVAGALAAVWITFLINVRGVGFTKWIENAGGLTTYLLAAILGAAALAVSVNGVPATALDARPALRWDTLNYLAQFTYAMTGFELLGMMGGEIRNPGYTVARAGWIAAVWAAIFYSASTAAILVLLPAAQVDPMFGISQAGEAAGAVLSLPALRWVVAALVIVCGIGQFGGLGAGTARMMYAAGVDGRLPAAFGRLHPEWRTPWAALLAMAAVCTVFLILMQIGETLRSAYQELVSLMVIVNSIPFVYLFLCAWRAGRPWSAVCGLLVTLAALAFSLLPTPDVGNVWLYEAKLAGGTAALLLIARWLYGRAPRRAVA
jgi:APA family basic amino acid/polyamine antiporter